MDWCRGRIFIKDLLAFPRVWSELKKHPEVAFIYNARNRFINPPPPGVRDWSIEFAVYVGGDKVAHICELQVKYVPIHLAVETGGSHEHYEYFRTYFSGGDRASVEKRMALLDKLGSADSVETFVRDAMEDEGESVTVAWLTFGRTLIFKDNSDLLPAHAHVCSSERM